MTFALKSHIFKMPFHTRLLHLLGILALAVASANAAITPTQTSITGLGNGIVGLVYPPQTGTSPNPNIKFSSNNTTASENKIWSATGVPPGLTFNPSGILSGKPSKAGNFTMNLSVRVGKQVRDTGSRTIVVVDTLPPIITPSTLPGGKLDNPYQANTPNNGFKLSGTGGTPFGPNSQYPTGYYWQLIPGKLVSQRLPQGMTLNPNGVISGTPVWPRPPVPSTSQTYTLQVRATDFLGKSATANFTLVIAPPQGPEILTDCPLPSGLEKYPYPVVQLKARYGKESYRWPKPAGLPPGLVWNERGYISGTPTTRGTYPITLQVIDTNGLSANKSCEIVIRPAPELDCPNIPCSRVGDTLVPVKLPVIGGDLPYTYNATGLPPSITINSNTGFISGNFTGGGNLTYNATFTVRDAVGRTANKTCQIVVKDRLEITTSNATALPFGIVGSSYPGKTGAPTVTINATGGWAPYTWQRILGELPPGLTINFATGAITGVPSKVGTYKFTIRVYDSCKPPEKFVEKEYTIVIYCPVTVLPDANNCLTVNRTFTSNLTASCGAAPYSWALVSSSSPSFSISVPDSNNSQVARLSGTPTQPGVVILNYTVTSLGFTESFSVNYTVSPELKITSACPPAEVTAGKAISPLNLTATDGNGNYTWNATITRNGTVVAPLIIANSRLNWTPPSPSTSPESYKIQFIVRDECGNVDSKECDVTIYPALSCNQTLNLPCLANGTVLPEISAFAASGGKTPYVWTLQSIGGGNKTLPAGLQQKIGPDADSSVLFGTITENGTFQFVATVSDRLGNTCSKNHTIIVEKKLQDTTVCPLVAGTNGTAYIGNLTATGGKGNYTWSLVPPSTGLPPGLTLNTSTGQIYGTPTASGNFSFSYKVTDSCGQEITGNCTIEIKKFTSLCSGRVTVIQICNENAAKDDNFDIHLNNEKIGDVDLSQDKKIGSLFIAHPTATITSGDFKCPIENMVIHRFDEKLVKTGANSLKMLNTKNNNNGNYGIIEIRSYKFDGTVLSDPRVISDVTYSGGSGADITPSDFSYACPEDTSRSSLAFSEVFSSAKVLGENEEDNMVAVAFNPIAISANSGGMKSNSLLKASNFKINRFEITNKCYVDFLNSIAQTDTNNLYSTQMSNIGIQKNSNNGTA
jgi:hypothetical protein